ncbi:MAG: hypothetical protein RL227_1890 [Pseudomonadota bacterium]
MRTPAPRRGRLLSGTAWNLFGLVLPLLVALVTIPWLIRLVGLDRFGFLALAWVLVGYTSLLDLGIGKAVIRTMSSRLALGDEQGALQRGRVGLMFLGALGLLMGVLLAWASELLVDSALKVPGALHEEALLALPLLAASLPFVLVTGGYVGVMSAHQDFKPLNLLRALLSVMTYLLPLALAFAGQGTLPGLVLAVLGVRVMGTACYAFVCWRRYGFSVQPFRLPALVVKELFSLGGWMTVSNLVGPLISYLDRLLLGTLVPLQWVGVYSAPYDLVQRLLMVPYALMAAWFPHAAGLKPRTIELEQALSDMLRWLFCAMAPLVLFICAVAHPAMQLWLGAEQGPIAATVLQLLVSGLLFNALAQGPATLILAAGHPRRIALLHLTQVPLFALLLWALTSAFGIVGTALAVALRFVLDAVAVAALAWFDLAPSGVRAVPWRRGLLPVLVFALLLGAAQMPRDLVLAAAVAVLGPLLFVVYAWSDLLHPHERHRVVAFLRQRWQRAGAQG